MTWLLRTRFLLVVAVVAWVGLAAIPASVPYPSIRAGIQWIDLGAGTVILPLVVALWHRVQAEAEDMIGPARLAPGLFDTALVAVLPIGTALLATLGVSSATHAVVPSLALGTLALVVGIRGVPRQLAGVLVVWLAVSMLLGPRADGSTEAWALPITTQASEATLLGLAIVFACACSGAVAAGAARWRMRWRR